MLADYRYPACSLGNKVSSIVVYGDGLSILVVDFF
ncbi:hypothetical protein SAMN05421772_1253 [Paracoccus saliphilus]|uniref:Uncharacterized protein n=1 Tax=Paracoccus saliphilus TaxID=405559 RepID=A0AA45W856_9RHOB|nr:hypothetical protein SAMN05421772_1253 [Paracoccus saliphilus]